MPKSHDDVRPPEETIATVEEYENAHDDYRVTTDGKRYVTALTTRGTCLICIVEDRE